VPLDVLREDQGAQPAYLVVVAHVDRVQVDALSPRHLHRLRQIGQRNVPAPLRVEQHLGPRVSPTKSAAVVVAIAVPEQVESRARADLQHRQRAGSLGDHASEGGQQAHAAL